MALREGTCPHGACPRYELILWDWNGTLLDDLHFAIDVRNRVFPRFGLKTLPDAKAYHEQFVFPVRKYYERAGVSAENFETVANAWMEEYLRGMGEVPLHRDALSALQAFEKAGIPQVILSASDLGILTKQLAQYEIAGYFADVLGLSHIYATSKAAIGEGHLRRWGRPREGCVLLGDTLHDAEVARELGTSCLLIARGHQSEADLLSSGFPVLDSLEAATKKILG